MKRVRWFGMVVLTTALVLAFSVALLAQEMPTIEVMDQTVQDNMVTIDRVVADQAGWVVIHIEQDGKPGPVIGWTAVPAGESTNVMVEIDVAKATPRLFAMLHVDAGEMGQYEFPGADVPVKVGDKVVVKPFNVTLPVLPLTGGEPTPWTTVAFLAGLGLILLGIGLRRFVQPMV